MNNISMLPITLDGKDIESKREEIREYFNNSYTLFESMFDILKDDKVFYQKSQESRHPMIFYFAHTAIFYINKLILGGVISDRLNPYFESIFAVGVDEMSWDDMRVDIFKNISINELREYRKDVKELVNNLISSLSLTLPITQDSPWWIILMGIEHERIHIETSSVLHREMPLQYILDLPQFNIAPFRDNYPQNSLVEMDSSTIRLGKDKNHHLYGWDNEYGVKIERVESFKVGKYLVSNGEFMEFVLDNGYSNYQYWSPEGIEFLKSKNITHPLFWIKDKSGFRYRTLTKEINMPLSWAVDVNYLEAEAFCRWKSIREDIEYSLPSEAEYRVLYNYANIEDAPNFDDNRANINLSHYYSACCVDRFKFGELYDVVGNVWQWSRSEFEAFDGFETHYIYDDFSTPTFDTKHNLIKGGSWISSGNEIMKESRYAFRRHFHQHAGFRYIVSKNSK